MDTERNTIQFMFLTEKKNGVFFYMGSDKDHLVAELVNGSLRVAADVGGGKIRFKMKARLIGWLRPTNLFAQYFDSTELVFIRVGKAMLE